MIISLCIFINVYIHTFKKSNTKELRLFDRTFQSSIKQMSIRNDPPFFF